jgi:hypothetical protein
VAFEMISIYQPLWSIFSIAFSMCVQVDLLILGAYEPSDSSLLLWGAWSINFDFDGIVDNSAGFEMIYDTNRKVAEI